MKVEETYTDCTEKIFSVSTYQTVISGVKCQLTWIFSKLPSKPEILQRLQYQSGHSKLVYSPSLPELSLSAGSSLPTDSGCLLLRFPLSVSLSIKLELFIGKKHSF